MIAGKALTIAGALVLAASLATACSSAGGPRAGTAAGRARPGATTVPAGQVVAVVAAESQYGDVAARVGGVYARVRSIMTDPNTDPHSFEISTGVARAVAGARVVVQNGLGYDQFMDRIESASPNRGRKVIVAADVLGLPADTANPHLWYDPAAVAKVADALAGALSAVEPSHAAYFEANAARFRAGLGPLLSALARFRREYPAVPVATTEPVADYLLQAAGARNLTPFSFQADVMNGIDPAPQDISIEQDLLRQRKVKALLYNRQVTDSLTQSFVRTARSAGVPVVGVYELMPVGESYAGWMLSTLEQLQKAVSSP